MKKNANIIFVTLSIIVSLSSIAAGFFLDLYTKTKYNFIYYSKCSSTYRCLSHKSYYITGSIALVIIIFFGVIYNTYLYKHKYIEKSTLLYSYLALLFSFLFCSLTIFLAISKKNVSLS